MGKMKKAQTKVKPAQMVRRKPTISKGNKPKVSAVVQRVENPGQSIKAADVLMLQRTLGNRAVGQLLQRKRSKGGNGEIGGSGRGVVLQRTPLTVGSAHDGFEKEAEVTASTIMNMTDHAPVGGQNGGIPAVQRVAPGQEQGLEGSFEVGEGFENRLNHIGGGQQLDGDTRDFMEPRFGADLGHVRLHTGGEAVQMNREVGARAFTHKNHIVMGENAQSPKTSAGKHLLAHEITHTFQQGAGRIQPRRVKWANKLPVSQKAQGFSSKPAGIQRVVPAYVSGLVGQRPEERSRWNPAKWFGKGKSSESYKRGWYNPKRWFGNRYNHDALLNPNISDPENHFRATLQSGGSWKRAVTARDANDTQQLTGNDTSEDTKMRQRNFNDFVANTPVLVLPVGTELLHMTSGSWGASSMPGGNAPNGYTFFTLAQSGPATVHNNSFSQMIRMRVTKDVHLFFLPNYNTFKIAKQSQNGRQKMDMGQPSVGGDLKNNILNYFPDFIPVAMAGHSEHELMFYNNIIPDIMEPARIAQLNATGTNIDDNNLTDIYNPTTNTDTRNPQYANQFGGHTVDDDAELPDYAMNHWRLFKWFGPQMHTGKMNPNSHKKFFSKLKDKVKSKRKSAARPQTNLFNKNTWGRYRSPKKWWNQEVRGEELDRDGVKVSNLDVDSYLDGYLN